MCGVTGRLESGDGLAYLADATPFEREVGSLEYRLIAEVEGLKTGVPPDGQQCSARTDHCDLEPSHLREGEGLGDESRECIRRSDRIARDEKCPSFDAIAEKGAPVAAEEVVQVTPQFEEVERVAAVSSNEIEGGVVRCAVGQVSWSWKRPEEEVPGSDDRREACHSDREWHPCQLVVECNRRMRPADRDRAYRARPASDSHVRPTRSRRGQPSRSRTPMKVAATTSRGERQASRSCRTTNESRPHHRNAAPAQLSAASSTSRPLSTLRTPRATSSSSRHLPRSPATAAQVEGRHDQRDARRDCERVEQRELREPAPIAGARDAARPHSGSVPRRG